MTESRIELGIASDELRRIGTSFGFGEFELPRPQFVAARVGRWSLPSGSFALKVFAASERRGARAEATLLAHLDGHGDGAYRVPRLIRTTSGAPLLELGDRRVLATSWEGGTKKRYEEIDAAGWRSLGRTLAALHLRLDHAPALDLPHLADVLRRRGDDAERRTIEAHRQLVDAKTEVCVEAKHEPVAAAIVRYLDDRGTLLQPGVDQALEALIGRDDRPIHNDYNVHNYLFCDAHPPTILDWERAIRAPREYEVVRTLNHLPIVAPELARAFVDGYLELRSLNPDRIDASIVASLHSHAVKHWPVQLWLDGEPGAAARIPGTAEVVRSLVGGRPQLEEFFAVLKKRMRADP